MIETATLHLNFSVLALLNFVIENGSLLSEGLIDIGKEENGRFILGVYYELCATSRVMKFKISVISLVYSSVMNWKPK